MGYTFFSWNDEEPAGSGVTVERWLPTDPGVRASASLYLTEAERQGITPGRRMLHVGKEPCPVHIAPSMSVAAGDPVFVRRKLMLADGVPVRIATSYFPADLAADSPLTAPDFVPGGLQHVLEEMGYRFGGADERLTARMPTPYETELLDLDARAPVVQVVRSSFGVRPDELLPVHTLETVCAADRHVFRIQQASGTDVF